MASQRLDALNAHMHPNGAEREHKQLDVCIVGGGLSGICLSVQLKKAGLHFLVLERAEDVGGTWHWNRFPGAACDVESYQYLPFLHEMGKCPTKKYVSSDEIRQHCLDIVQHYQLRPHFQLNTNVVAAKFSNENSQWIIQTNTGRKIIARSLVLACGPLSTPKIADIKGLNTFQGQSFHTARWPSDANLDGRIVGVIGTGATAVQVVPEVSKVAGKLFVFQRSACYCIPKNDTATSDEMRKAILNSPEYLQKYRSEGIHSFDTKLFKMFNDKQLNAQFASMVAEEIRNTVKDKETADKLIPTYPVGCKRLCISDDYYATYNRSNVTLVHNENGIREIEEDGVVMADGAKYKLDTLILATGYDAWSGSFRDFSVEGLDGKTLMEHWKHGPRTACGVHVKGFPNMFLMIGPQVPTILVNVTFAIEMQAKHIVKVIQKMKRHKDSRVEPMPGTEEYWVDHCRELYSGSVWSQCISWYNKEGTDGGADTYTGTTKHYEDSLSEMFSHGLHYYS
eukprot:m.64227 g.64227  ORF g.64227 m.64227 type:complete len:509 (+) comp11632_c0_seq1:168-1694(+)